MMKKKRKGKRNEKEKKMQLDSLGERAEWVWSK